MTKKIGFIPLRKGSKGIKNKNTKKIVGRPLFTWVLTEALFSDLDEVYVFTDDLSIKEFVENQYQWSPKVKVLLRNNKNANDSASTESAMLEFSNQINHEFDILCLLQATSPLTTSKDINGSLAKITDKSFDSVVSVVKTHRFTWNENGTPKNYNVFKRPRRQEFEGLLIENGAIYATTKKAFLKSKNRVSGKIGLIKMPEESLLEIDTETDWIAIEQMLIEQLKKKKETSKITHLVLDVDGVFTDGSVYYSKDGELSKQFDMRDGMGLEILREQGVEIIVMTSEQSELVAQRMKKLQLSNVYLGVKDKYALLKHLITTKEIELGSIAYMGDDINDLANICSVGWSLIPKNATQIVKQYADIVLTKDSGNGAIREACEFILNYNKRF